MAYIQERKALPQRTTLAACCSELTVERISRFFAFLRVIHQAISSLNLPSLASGSLASILIVSSVMPKKGKVVDGPSTFSKARGTPKYLHIWVNISKLCWQIKEDGGPIVKKSSR